MSRAFGDYVRNFVENLDTCRVYRRTSGLCAAIGLALAMNTEHIEDKHTPPQDTRTDIEVVLDAALSSGYGYGNFKLPTRRKIKISSGVLPDGSDSELNIDIYGVDTKLRDLKNSFERCEQFRFYLTEKRFEPRNPLKDSQDGPRQLTEEEVEEVKSEYGEVFSNIAKHLRRNMEIERRFREDVLKTGRIAKSHKEPTFNYPWIPSWSSALFSRIVVDSMEKEYDIHDGKAKVTIYSPPRKEHCFEVSFWKDGHFVSEDCDIQGDGYFETDIGIRNLTVLDRLAPLVGMEDE